MIQEFNAANVLQAGTIGNLLVESGRITKEQANKVLALQKKENIRFGEAAIKLGFIQDSDIKYALSRQFSYSFLEKNDKSFSQNLVAAYEPYIASSEALRGLRGQIKQHWLSHGNKTFIIASSELDADAEYVAANLAVVFSQLEERTLLIDANLRAPNLHTWFHLEKQKGLSDILAGRSELDVIVVLEKLQGLSILTAGTEAPNPQELLSRPKFSFLLEQLKEYFDVIIINTSPLSESADAQVVADKAKGVLFVMNKDKTKVKDIKKAIEQIESAGAQIIGSVLNERGK